MLLCPLEGDISGSSGLSGERNGTRISTDAADFHGYKQLAVSHQLLVLPEHML